MEYPNPFYIIDCNYNNITCDIAREKGFIKTLCCESCHQFDSCEHSNLIEETLPNGVIGVFCCKAREEILTHNNT